MKRRDFIKGAVIAGGLAGAGMLAGAGDADAASNNEGEKKSTQKKALVIYASRTNNTTKVAERFKSTLEKTAGNVISIKLPRTPIRWPYPTTSRPTISYALDQG